LVGKGKGLVQGVRGTEGSYPPKGIQGLTGKKYKIKYIQ
jgi:hypothetical protein